MKVTAIHPTVPSEIAAEPVLDALYHYWECKRQGRALPARRDIDPLEMGPRLLPHLLLSDLMDRGQRLRFRLVGTELVKHLGADPTGQFLSEIDRGSFFDLLARLHRSACQAAAPLYSEAAFRWGANRSLEIRQLLLPLSNGGREPAIMLTGIAFRSKEAFPPQIRALEQCAALIERQRLALARPVETPWEKQDEQRVPLSVA